MLAIPLAGCSQDEGADGGKETIKIGGLAPLSGDVSQYGVAVNNAVKMAVEDINAKGGILGGRKIEYIVTDEKGDSTEAVNAYNALMDQEIVALIGDVTSVSYTHLGPGCTGCGISVSSMRWWKNPCGARPCGLR